ncbi:MAG: DegV family protein [Candidatus Limnocylindrales bacterium]
MNVAIVTDSGSDLTPTQLLANRIVQVPLSVSFGTSSYLSPDEMKPEEFWRRLLEPGAPFPHTAAASAGQFKQVFERAFEGGADGIVCVTLAETLSATIRSAQMAKDMLPDREIHIVDSRTACMGIGALALRGAGMAAQGFPAAKIAAELTRIRESVFLYVALETLEFLRKGGRISAAQAAIGGLLSVKPIITVVDGLVVTADKPRTRSKARARVIELLSARPVAEVHLLYSPPAEVDDFRDELLAHLPAPAPKLVTAQIIGPVIGAHVGPGVLGAVLLRPT